METGALGKVYQNGEVILSEGGAAGRYMFVIQTGQVEVVKAMAGKEVRLAVRGRGEFIGEMEVFEGGACYATVRALGEVRVLQVDKKTLLRQMHEEPSLAFNLVQSMSARLRELSDEVSRLRSDGRPGGSLRHVGPRAGSGTPTIARQAGHTVISMSQPPLALTVRPSGPETVIIDLHGVVTAQAEPALTQAFTCAAEGNPHRILLNFGGLERINSGGLGLVVTLRKRARHQSMSLLAYALSERFRIIFELAGLDKVIRIHASEAEAVAAPTP